MHAQPPDSAQTELIDRIDGGQTGQFPAVHPPAAPRCGHPAVWRWTFRLLVVYIYATFGVWGWGLYVAAKALWGWS